MDFGAFLRSLGLRPRTIAADGRWRRCGTSDKPRSYNGAYKLAIDGRVGWAQDWAVMREPVTWKAGDAPAVAFDRDAQRRAEAEQRRARIQAQHAALLFWSGCRELRGPHPYLQRKQLDATGCHHLRVDGEGWLVVPAFINGTLVSVQRIAPDGTKRFFRGAPIGGSSFEIWRRQYAVTILCEGLATGLACFRAVQHARVLVAWDAGNLARTPERPSGLVVVAADNDHGTQDRLGRNPGLEAAKEAANAIGCGVAWPEGIAGTDFADYRVEHIAARMGRRFNGRPSEGEIGRTVDAEIAVMLMKAAKWVRPRDPTEQRASCVPE